MKRYIYKTDFIDNENIMLGVPLEYYLKREKEIELDCLLNAKDNEYLFYRIDDELKQAVNDLSRVLKKRVLCPDAYFPIYSNFLSKGNHVGVGFIWHNLEKYPYIWSDVPIPNIPASCEALVD